MKKPTIILTVALVIFSLCGCSSWGRYLFEVPEAEVTTLAVSDSQTDHSEISGYQAATDGYTCYHLAILVNFLDIQLTTTEDEWESFFYGDWDSVRSYYLDQTKGLINVTPVAETYGETDNGVIIVDADMMHPDFDSEYMQNSNDDNATLDFFEEVLYRANDYIDFGQYDFNGDEVVLPDEMVITIIAAGYQENANFVYDEKAVMGLSITENYYSYFDDVGIDHYLLTGEIHFDSEGNEIFPTIGVACHEFGHALGLPDLYDTDHSSQGAGIHALMADGDKNRKWDEAKGTRPAPLTAWSKLYLGLIEPQVVSDDGEYDLYTRTLDAYNVIKIQEDGIYYLLENVDFSGYGEGLNKYIQLPGIAVWRIDESRTTEVIISNNAVNDEDDRQGVMLIEAGGTNDLEKEEFDYSRDDYNHYFSINNGGKYITDGGTVITFLSEPGEVMTVDISF